MNPVFTFDTTHHALWAEEIAQDNRVPYEVVGPPLGSNARCSIALETLTEEESRLARLLESSGIQYRIYRNEPA